jgi:hypothetical protein
LSDVENLLYLIRKSPNRLSKIFEFSSIGPFSNDFKQFVLNMRSNDEGAKVLPIYDV